MVNSVHLQKIPNFNAIPYSADIVEAMSLIKKICNAALSIRKKNNIKARIPLSSITIAGNCEIIKNNKLLIETIKDEINVKSIVFLEDFSNFSVKKVVSLNASKVAKRLGKEFQAVLKLAKAGNFENAEQGIKINGHEILEDEFEIQLLLENKSTNYTSIEGKWLVVLEITITQELQNEGIARDFIRAVQNARKENTFEITEKIAITVHSQLPEITHAINENFEYIKEQVLAKSLSFSNSEIQNGIEFCEGVRFEVIKN